MKHEEVYRDIASRILKEAKTENAMFKLLCEMSEAAVQESMKINRERQPEKEINMHDLVEEIASKKPEPPIKLEIIVEDNQQMRMV